ncbi:MAG: hypothetical protein C5B50_00295 [Verrucomicrobia bacterium]|nr:MAG: hypothetical protein C5B50_00295 [Verrucomicrobiota bacterium]
MKTVRKSAKARLNGSPHSREELLAANARALKATMEMTREEKFQSLVRAGICTADGKLTRRYGG